jgi:DNA-binding transcriptional ArsR family regulator
MRYLPHPLRDHIELTAVLEALSDPTRLAIVLMLDGMAEEFEAQDQPEQRCSAFGHLGSKTNLTYHFARLRAAGITHARAEGTSRFISLRRADLDSRFPGLLDTVITAARGGKPAARAQDRRRSARRSRPRPPPTAASV